MSIKNRKKVALLAIGGALVVYSTPAMALSDARLRGDQIGPKDNLLAPQVSGRTRTNFALAEAQQTSLDSGSADIQSDQTQSEEIVVTAQKREEKLQDVPVSMTVLGGRELDRSTAEGVNEVLLTVPGVAATEALQGGNTQISIRGVTGSAPTLGGSSPIAYYLDGLPFSFVKNSVVPDADVYDLERVEVLRGPQGTLYGASALNGVVRVLTKDADLNAFGAKARGALSSTEHGGTNYRGDASINVPIIEGKLALRATASYQGLSGWINQPSRRDVNDGDTQSYRIKLNAAPTDRLTIGLSAWFSRTHFDAPAYGTEDRDIPNVIDEPINSDYNLYGLKIGYDFGSFVATSNTSYIRYQNETVGALAPILAPPIQETGLSVRTFNQELNLASTGQGPWRWTLGGMYRKSTEDQSAAIPAFFMTPSLLNFRSESFAVFGELTRLFADGEFELTGGLRYFEDRLRSVETSTFFGTQPAGVFGKDKFDKISPRVVLNWHPDHDLTVYASYSQGFRSGGSPTPNIRTIDPNFPATRPDTLANYEIGSKGSLFDGMLSYDAAVYYIDWKDIQLSLPVRVGNIFDLGIINSESASGLGAEFGVTLRPTRNLSLTGNFAFNELSVDENVTTVTGVTVFPKGSRLNQSPKYTAGGSVNFDVPLGGGYEARLTGSLNYVSRTHFKTLLENVVFVSPGDSLITGAASFSLESPDNWSASLFVSNFTDENKSPLQNFFGFPYWDQRIRPRTFGLQIEYRY